MGIKRPPYWSRANESAKNLAGRDRKFGGGGRIAHPPPYPLSPKVPVALHYSHSARLFCAFFRVPVEQLLKDLQLFFLPDTTTTPLQYTAILDHQMSFFLSLSFNPVLFSIVSGVYQNCKFWGYDIKTGSKVYVVQVLGPTSPAINDGSNCFELHKTIMYVVVQMHL